MDPAIADLFIDDWDDDWGGTSYNNSTEEKESHYGNYSDFDYHFEISEGEIWADVIEKRFKFDYLVCMDPNGDPGVRDEYCNVYSKGTLYPFFEELYQYEIPEGVKKIREGTFSDCENLRSVTIPDSVTTIEKEAFKDCRSLTSITIPESVTFIGEGAFSGCSRLVRSSVPDWVIAAWSNAFDDRISKASADGFRIEGHTLISYSGEGGDVTIPDGVTTIGKDAFSRCSSLTSITIPDGVTTIGTEAFSRCSSLTSITIPNSVTTIGIGAFSHCGSLTSVTIPDGVTTIGTEAFYWCEGLTSITIPNSVMTIGTSAFGGCSQARVTIPRRLESAMWYWYSGHNIKFSD